MRVVKPSENGPGGTQGLEELKHVENVKKEVQEDGLRIIKDTEDTKDKHAEDLVRPQVEIHRPQPQPQPNVVRWERFLPIRSLKVMLVEYDDSTRHVVSALLRNCSYEVTAVPNGVEAWKILEDLNNQIDLVLTEVVMPGLSGIGLLSKMMSHKSRQNIPVIMMSSHDSMGVVLKCLSKGAVDFLVKPIRKNELKNLWQHIWRKCHSSSGSGSESGIRTEKSIGAQGAEESDNDSGSDDEDDTRSVGLQVWDGSDNGSGTQSSWTKRAAEVETPQPMSPCNQLDPPDSTCAQVIYPTEAFASSWVTVPMKEHIEPANLPDVSMGKEEIAIRRNADSQLKEPSKKMAIGTSTEKNQISQSDLKKDGRKFEKGKVEISNENSKGEWIKQTANLTGDIASNDEHHRGSVGSKIPTAVSTIAQNKDQVMENVKDLPSLELSLKSLGDDAKALTDAQEQNILRRSQLSAFTSVCRYVTGSTANQGQTGNVGSCSPLGDSSEAVKQSNSECNRPNQNSNSSSNNSDMGSTNKGSSRKPATATDKVPAKSTVNCSYPSSAFQSAETGHVSNPQLMVSGKPSSGPSKVVPSKENYMFHEVHIQHHHHHHHHHDHHVYSVQKLDHDDLSLKNISETSPQCGSSNAGRVVNETNAAVAADCSVYGNGNACVSNHGSNMHNGSSAVVDAEGMSLVNGNGVAANDGICNGSGSGSGVGVDQSCSAQRQAALNKFRQKRKERCFEKRVRYQSRKKLAEQRPRIRGQFVRQARETKGEDADS